MSGIVECIRKLGYKSFTELQKKAFNKVAGEGRSVLILAPTGSGKTEAAVLPVFYRVRVEGLKPIAVIYITPLRALNRDIEGRIKKIASCFELSVAVRHGDTPEKARRELADNPPHVLITTPESFAYIIVNEKLRHYIANTRYLIIDEFHEMVRSKRGLLFLTILYLLGEYHGFKPLRIALSATLSNPSEYLKLLSPIGEDVEVIVDEYVKKMDVKVVVPGKPGSLSLLGDDSVDPRLSYIVDAGRRYKGVLVFTNTRSLAEMLGSLLRKLIEKHGLDLKVGVHHGSLSRSRREEVESGFKQGELNILVATSSMELGIDIGHIDFVIQYLSPRQSSRLIQRIGRSGHRLKGIGRGVVLSTINLLHLLESLILVDEALRNKVEKEEVISKPLDVLAYAMALLVLLNPGGVNRDELYDRLVRHVLYRDLSPEEFNRLIEYMVYTHVLRDDGGLLKPTRKTRLYVYRTSMIPSTRDIHVVEVSTGRTIGSLNEEYVILRLRPDDVIILAGEAWRVIGFDDEKGHLYVEKTKGDYAESLIPHWEGENIPVDTRVALRIGEVIDYVKKNKSLPEELKKLLETNVEIPWSLAEELSGYSRIYVDYVEKMNLLIININAGSKVNSLIRDVITYLLRQRFPIVDFTSYSSPYAVLVRVKGYIYPAELINTVKTIIINLGKYIDNNAFLRSIVKDSQALYWRIYQVAQRFGAITPGETGVTKSMLNALADTIIGEEAFKEVLIKDYDLESARSIASLITGGGISVETRVYDDLARHHLEILGYIELPIRKDVVNIDISQYLERLLERELTLLCLKCGYIKQGKVRELLEIGKYSCPRCGLATLTIVKGDAEEEKSIVEKLRRGMELKGGERRLLDDLAKRAVILYKFGKQALLVFAGRGVGTSEAVRILNNASRGTDLVREIYEREKTFLRVKKYIDSKDDK
jgi:ATP-dependent Lhr-like helicase